MFPCLASTECNATAPSKVFWLTQSIFIDGNGGYIEVKQHMLGLSQLLLGDDGCPGVSMDVSGHVYGCCHELWD